MQESIEKYLSTILEGYEKSLEGVTQFIDQNSQQLETARSQRDEIVENVAELKELLGLNDEPAKLALVEDEAEETVSGEV